MAEEQSVNRIAVITVNWNGWRHTLECLASLRKSEGTKWKLFIVDNASSDESLRYLENLGQDVCLIRSGINGGWTGGNNIGLQKAKADGFNKFFLLNNDAVVLPDTLLQLMRISDQFRNDAPLLGPVQLSGDGLCYNFVGAEVDEGTGIPKNSPVGGIHEEKLPTYWATAFIRGSGIFLSSEHLEQVGFFDDRFFLNYDETDWCFRARKLGIESVMVRDAKILHAESGSIGGMSSPLSTYFLIRNELLFAKRHCSGRQRWKRAKELVHYGRWLSGGGRMWPLKLMASRSRTVIPFRLALRDFVLGRFGDCPPVIRELSSRR